MKLIFKQSFAVIKEIEFAHQWEDMLAQFQRWN